jgi:hypothetical protein
VSAAETARRTSELTSHKQSLQELMQEWEEVSAAIEGQ